MSTKTRNWPKFNRLDNDPALRKGAALAGMPGTSSYFNDVSAFNRDLARPSDTIPAPADPIYVPPVSPPGWEGITNPGRTSSYNTPYGLASVRYPSATIAAFPGMRRPAPIVSETTPSTTQTTGPDFSSWNNNTYQMTDSATPETTAPAPAENSMQRWGKAAGEKGVREISDARRYFWATGRIDGRAPQADLSQNIGAIKMTPFRNANGTTSKVGMPRPANSDWSAY